MKKVSIGVLISVGMLAAQTGISGHVYDATTNQPIANAVVKVYSVTSHHHPVAVTYTDSGGYYEFDSLEAGAYFVFSVARGYRPQFYNGATNFFDADTVYVVSGQMTENIDFYLTSTHHGGGNGVIMGSVVDEATGEPIPFAFVIARDNGDRGHHRHTFTDENGNYVLNLDAGTYIVAAYKWGYQPEWYYESSTPDGATPIEVNDGDTVANINFTLTPPTIETATITGVVIDSITGEPIAGAVVHVHDTAMHRGGQHGGGHWGGHHGGHHGGGYGWHYGHLMAVTDSNGQYTLDVPAPGTYFVGVSAWGYEHEFYDNASSRLDATPVTVNPDDVIEINFDLTPCDSFPIGNSTISGMVIDENTGEPIPGAIVMGFIPRTQRHPRRISLAVTDSLGNFVLENLPEGENIYVFAKAHGYFGEFYDDAYSFDSATAVVPPAENITIDLVPRDSSCYGSGGIAGLVVGNDNDPFAYGVVFATSLDDGLTYIDVSDATGYYGLDELPPGTYEVSAIAVGESGSYKGVAFGTVEVVDSYVDHDVILTPTDVEEGEPTLPDNLMLTVAPLGRAAFGIEFALSAPSRVSLSIYDASGRLVRNLFKGELQSGTHSFTVQVNRSGAYFVRLATDEGESVRKVIVVK